LNLTMGEDALFINIHPIHEPNRTAMPELVEYSTRRKKAAISKKSETIFHAVFPKKETEKDT